MATIQSQLTLNDGMSAVLKKINSALTLTLNSFERVQRASGQAVDTANIQEARAGLVEANSALKDMEEGYRRAAEEERKLNQGVRDGTGEVGKMLNKIKSLVATLGLAKGAQMTLNLSDNIALGSARLKLLIDDEGTAAAFENKIMESANRSRAAYLDTFNTVTKLGLMAGKAFMEGSSVNMDEVLAFTETLNKNFIIGGASATEQAAAMYQLTQAMSSGRLQGDEYRSIIEHAPLLATAIEDYMRNVQGATGSMKEWASEGMLTADVIKAAVFSSADEVEKRFAQMPMTWGQIWTLMQNKAISIFKPILQKLNDIANSPGVIAFVDTALGALVLLANFLTFIFDSVCSIGGFISANWTLIAPIIYGIAAALAVYLVAANAAKIAEMATAVWTGITTAAKVVATAATWMFTSATLAQAGAQWGLNAALYACPLVWILIIIIAIIAIIYAVIAAINKFAGTSISATGVICGAFMAAFAFIGNILIAAWNLVVDVFTLICNLVAEVANFIGNVFTDPIGAVCRLFFGLADTVLEILQALASAIDTIFGSNLAGSVQGWRDSLGGWVDDTFGKGTEVMAKMNADDLKLGRFEYGAAYDLGYNFGAGLESDISDAFNPDSILGTPSSGFDFDKMAGDVGNIADNTGKSAEDYGDKEISAEDYGDKEISEEQLKYLRDIAERDAINRFTTAEVKIDMTGMTNKIEGGEDLDGVISKFTDGFAEALLTAAEGVH